MKGGKLCPIYGLGGKEGGLISDMHYMQSRHGVIAKSHGVILSNGFKSNIRKNYVFEVGGWKGVAL